MFRIIVIQIILIRIIMVSAIIREDSRRWAHSPIVATPGEVQLREVSGPLEEPVECARGAAVPHLAQIHCCI